MTVLKIYRRPRRHFYQLKLFEEMTQLQQQSWIRDPLSQIIAPTLIFNGQLQNMLRVMTQTAVKTN